jgi:hypothetical protein
MVILLRLKNLPKRKAYVAAACEFGLDALRVWMERQPGRLTAQPSGLAACVQAAGAKQRTGQVRIVHG